MSSVNKCALFARARILWDTGLDVNSKVPRRCVNTPGLEPNWIGVQLVTIFPYPGRPANTSGAFA